MQTFRPLLVSVATMCLFSQAAMAADAAPAVASPAVAQPAPAPAAGGPVTRQEIPALVKEALLNDPEIIMQAIQKLRDKQAEEAKKKAEGALIKHRDALFNNPAAPSIGNTTDSDVTVVEFFDYHCGYCKHFLPTVSQLVKEDKKVRVVFIEFPILSEDSVTAAKAALAVNRIAKDKYFDFHTALMKASGKFDEKALLDIAKKLGISEDKLKAEMGKEEVSSLLDKNREMASELGINGTPAIIIGNEVTSGAVPYDELKKLIAEARTGKNAAAPQAQPKP